MDKKTISIDFDGVIHKYSQGWQDGKIYDEPVEGAFENILRLMEQFEIVILTTRAKTPTDKRAIRRWLIAHGLPKDKVSEITITNVKGAAFAFIDDRAIRFTNWNDVRKYFD